MRLVFWLNSLSPHQLPYIVHLIDSECIDSVVVVVGETINKNREKMGWDKLFISENERCEIIVSPDNVVVQSILSYKSVDSCHLFSGIRGFRFVFNAFKLSLQYKTKRAIITERPNTYAFGYANGKPLWLHRLRWLIQDYKYIHKVDYVFAMGEAAVDFFQSLSNHWTVFPFGYCTYDNSNLLIRSNQVHFVQRQMLRVVYVGGLFWWKSINTLLYSTQIVQKKCQNEELLLTLIGDGPERTNLEKIVKDNQLTYVRMLGVQKQSLISDLLSEQDVLVLPSIYDGWGAVVNEGLQAGLYIICSDRCGAKDLLDDKRCGAVFKAGDIQSLTHVLQECMKNIGTIRENRLFRINWAKNSISGEVMAQYMVDCICFKKRLKRPWKIQ